MEHAAAGARTNVIALSRRRGAADRIRIEADDRLIEEIRAGRVTDASPVHPVARMLARWRRDLLAVS